MCAGPDRGAASLAAVRSSPWRQNDLYDSARLDTCFLEALPASDLLVLVKARPAAGAWSRAIAVNDFEMRCVVGHPRIMPPILRVRKQNFL